MILLVRNSPVVMVAAALALGASPSLSEAFVVHPSSSAISASAWRRGITSSAFPARRPVRGDSPVTSTSLQMNLADRFFRVAKANLNNILQKVEDPEKILEQAVEDMQKDLVKVRQSYAEVSASQKRMERQREHAEGLAKEWYNRAQLALQNGDEGLAKEALARRQQQLDVSANLSQQMAVQGEAIDKLRESTQQLESKITEAKGQKDTLIARARTAKTTTQVNDMLGNLSGTTSMGAFDRMQEKVEALEANAEISGELSGATSASLEGQFKALEGKSAIDEELEKMKGLLPQKKDPPPLLTTSASSEVESELDQMKKDLERGAGQ